ncbi:MAG: DUF1854 domain-containing protein [Clostridia bacterium]|nr:DUF1854 domain-containing protein [Clostridia bacterium]
MEHKNKKTKQSASTVKTLTPETVFFYEKNGFAALTLSENGEKTEYSRVFFHRNFPFDMPFEYISVLDDEENEIGMLRSLDTLEKTQRNIVISELDKKYYQPEIKAVLSLKERYGFSYWKVKTADDRDVSFTMQDTFRHIIRAGSDKLIMLDVDGNRFVINSIAALDRKSYRKIELYL